VLEEDQVGVKEEVARPEIRSWQGDAEKRAAIAEALGRETSSSMRQRLYNYLFDEVGREAKVAVASEDRKGRKVRYYRIMGQEDFNLWIEHAKLNAEVLTDPLTDKISSKDIAHYLYYLVGSGLFFNFSEDISPENVFEYLPQLFPAASAEEVAMVSTTDSAAVVRGFLFKYANREALKFMHRGSSSRLNPYFSCSVGGPSYLYQDPLVCVELVIPDDKVEVESGAFEEEKEVYLTNLDLAWVTRVYAGGSTGNEQWIEEVIYNPEIPIGEHTVNRYKSSDSSYSEVGAWTRDEELVDCLPVGLLD